MGRKPIRTAAILTLTLLAAAGLACRATAGQDATGERGRLEGVEDTVLLKFRHVHELPARGGDDVDKLHQEIIKRLADSG